MKASQKEVEIKFRIENAAELGRKLHACGFRQVTKRTHEMNVLYDSHSQALARRGEMLRIRKYGEKWKVTHKAKGLPGRHKSRVETETSVENGGALHQVFTALGLVPTFRYEKFRAEWSDGKGQIVLDETPIGYFGEIEGKPRWIDAIAKRLGIERSQYITDNYASLFFAWKLATGSAAEEMTFRAVRKKA